MPVLILFALIAAGFAVQYFIDRSHLQSLVSARGWRLERVTFAPWSPGWFLRSRNARSYRLHFRDGQGRLEQRTCVLGGSEGFRLEPAGVPARLSSAPSAPLSRPVLVSICAPVGAFLGAAVGIAGSFAIYPGSNIAPAYGIILMGPLGLLAGALFGLLRGR